MEQPKDSPDRAVAQRCCAADITIARTGVTGTGKHGNSKEPQPKRHGSGVTQPRERCSRFRQGSDKTTQQFNLLQRPVGSPQQFITQLRCTKQS